VETSIAEIRTGLDKGWFTVSEYIEAALERIGSMDQQGPMLNAVIELNPEAMEIAAQLDQEARSGRLRGPMHGIPVLVKDIYATADMMRTTAGSLALADNRVVQDAFMIEVLRDAGAVILGKTNLTEFSNFRGGTPNGWSSRGGLTVNPHVLTHTAWGSSTGSAVAVASSYVPFSIGSETDGSIICPASACGVVGLKPTVGLVSRRGGLGISFIQDSPGPMGRSVEDVAYALSAMVGYDAQDMAFGQFAAYAPAARFDTMPVPDPGVQDYTRALDKGGLKGARIGVCRSMFGFDPVVDAHVEIALDAMRQAGAEVIDDIYMEAAGIVRDGVGEGNMLIMEFAWNFQNFLDTWMPGGPITSLADVINFNYEHAEETMVHGGQEGLEAALYTGSIEDPWFEELVATNVRATRDDGIDLTMDEYDLDALVAPSTTIPGDMAGNLPFGSSSQVPSMAGYPSLTLPIGYTNGLPAGLHMFGRAFSEKTLLKLAYSLEQSMQVRQAPKYLEEVSWDDGMPSWEETPEVESGI
jgi:amidase